MSSDAPLPLLHSLAAAARRMGISLRSLRHLIARGEIATCRPTRRRVLVAEADLVAYVESRRTPATRSGS